MRSVKLTLRRDGGSTVDLLAGVEAEVTVGALARAMAQRGQLAAAGYSQVTLGVEGPTGVAQLDPAIPVDATGLRSGATVTVLPASPAYPGAGAAGGQATLVVLEGPDAGLRVPLAGGVSTIGRDSSCAVVLTDRQVSKFHAQVEVTDTVEIVDTNSTNGTLVGGGPVNRARLRPDDTALLGDTVIAVYGHAPAAGAGHSSRGEVPYNRSPRLDPPYVGVELEAPTPPTRPARRPLPLIPLLAPLALGAVLYLVSHSLYSLVFVALSPIMLIGNFTEGALANRRAFRAAVAEFEAALGNLDDELADARVAEQDGRRREHPATGEVLAAAERLSPLLWTRRPEHASFLELRLGLGTLPSRNTVKLPNRGEADRGLWQRLLAVLAPHATVSHVPVVARPRTDGAFGVAGPDEAGRAVARGLVAQAVGLHSPAELVLAAVMSTTAAAHWSWLKWLPHSSAANVSSSHAPLRTTLLTAGGDASDKLLAELDDLIAQRSQRETRTADPLPQILLLVSDDSETDRSRLVDIAERGPAHGVHVLWLAATVEQLPAACRTYLEAGPATGTGTAGFVHTGSAVQPIVLEPVTAGQAEALARHLAPVVDAGTRVDADNELPRSVSFLRLAKARLDQDADAVIERWRESDSISHGRYTISPEHDHDQRDQGRRQRFRALVGAAGKGEAFHLDLRQHGPHALVGGTTGAGKSELLQSWIIGMATAASPDRVTFLFVDYKGGAAFGACERLPHAVGLVTDLSPRLVQRALASLRAELRYREGLLGRFKVKDLTELEENDPAQAPPRLVIVVDEFAALKQEVPEFVTGVVDVAARGRSLGLHLILATQQPAGVITDSLRANTNLRIALRMADEADSSDVLGSPMAAGFDPAIPGRAVAKTGPGQLVTFQTAYLGGWTSARPPQPAIEIETLTFGPGVVWPGPKPPRRDPADLGATDIVRIVDTVRHAAEQAGIPLPRQPWLPELDTALELGELLRTAARELADERRTVPEEERDRLPAGPALVFGRRDRPTTQAQPPVAFHPDHEGNLLVLGTGGTGKSTLLRTVALSAIESGAIGPSHVYGIEFGARGLSVLDPLPQVGEVIRGDDTDRVTRLLSLVSGEIDRRAMLFGRQHNARSIEEYWQRVGEQRTPRLLLLLDGMGAFTQQYPPGGPGGVFERLLTIATDGRAVGVHLLVSADRPSAVPGQLASALQRRIVLRLSGDNDYATIGLRSDALPPDAPSGRCLSGTDEAQIAVYGGIDPVRQQEAIARLAARTADVASAPPVPTLPAVLRLLDLPSEVADEPAFALVSDSLAPIGFPTRGTFLLTGPGGSGRSTALRTIVTALHRTRPGMRLYLLGGRPFSALENAPLWTEAAAGREAAEALAKRLLPELRTAPDPVALVIEAAAEFNGYDTPVQQLAKELRDAGHLVIFEGEASSMGRSGPLQDLVRPGRTGLLLQPNPAAHSAVLPVEMPRGIRQSDFPVGRGLLFVHGNPIHVQVAVATE